MINNNKFVPVAPKTYEVRYVENKGQSNLSRFASYLGIKIVENCNSKPCTCVDTTGYSEAAKTAALQMQIAVKAAAQSGGTAQADVKKDGTAKVTYEPKK